MANSAHLIEMLTPFLTRVAATDLSDASAAEAALADVYDATAWQALHGALRDARDAGWLTPRSAGPRLSFGRLAKPGPDTLGMAVDVVDIEGVGAAHTHPRGEVSLCFIESGDPRFDGHPGPIVVKPPGSQHAPTVTGGRMIIVYALPEGAIDWHPAS